MEKLEAIAAQGKINDVEGLEPITAAQAREMEPELACAGALISPETGIVDAHAYMLALQGDIEDAGGMIAFNTPVTGAVAQGRAVAGDVRRQRRRRIRFRRGGELRRPRRAETGARDGRLSAARVPRLVLAKGNYFTYTRRPVFTRLIYPVPAPGGLGVHVTLDLAGRMRFGPDVEWIDREYYPVDPARAESFYGAIRRYWPNMPDGALAPDYSGIRPKLTGPGEAAADFMIDAPAQHGLPGLVQMFGIESPGLTSSLSLAEQVANELTP